ncbi:MAG TPA: TolC family protein [Gemmataceae bacterium]|nr:TolC family protein [Gemmataceae bacterium]
MFRGAATVALALVITLPLCAQDTIPTPRPLPLDSAPALPPIAEVNQNQARLPITLPTALQLAQANPIDVALASVRLDTALAQQSRARAQWLPTVYAGVDYARHDGVLQDVSGNIISTDKQSFMAGAGPGMTLALSEAIFAPLAAQQVVRSREADRQATLNDVMFSVADAYFRVQQARGEVAGNAEALVQTEELVRRTDELAKGIVPPSEANRARTELARRKQALESALERWKVAGADLTRILRLQAGALVEPLEPPHLQIQLLDSNCSVDDLISQALTNRPELASRQALVQATLERLRQEKLRPLIPSVLLHGNATNPAGIISSGVFGGNLGNNPGGFGGRNSIDFQLLWEFQNLGFGNRAAVRERRADNSQAIFEFFRQQDQIAAEVVQALANAQSADARVVEAAEGLKQAKLTYDRSLEGMKTIKSAGEFKVTFVRPSEAISAAQGLAQASVDFYTAVADYNRAQFRLYRAIGQPAQYLPGNVNSEPHIR